MPSETKSIPVNPSRFSKIRKTWVFTLLSSATRILNWVRSVLFSSSKDGVLVADLLVSGSAFLAFGAKTLLMSPKNSWILIGFEM